MLKHAHAPLDRILLHNINEHILNLKSKYRNQDHYNQRYFLFNLLKKIRSVKNKTIGSEMNSSVLKNLNYQLTCVELFLY